MGNDDFLRPSPKQRLDETTHAHALQLQQNVFKIDKSIKLVVVMSVVILWKPRKLLWCTHFRGSRCKWRFVSIAENLTPSSRSEVNSRNWSTPINTFSASFSSLLHRAQAHNGGQIFERIGRYSAE